MRFMLHDENGVMQRFILDDCESPPLHFDVPSAGLVRAAYVSESDVALTYTVDRYELVGVYDGDAMYQRVSRGTLWPTT